MYYYIHNISLCLTLLLAKLSYFDSQNLSQWYVLFLKTQDVNIKCDVHYFSIM